MKFQLLSLVVLISCSLTSATEFKVLDAKGDVCMMADMAGMLTVKYPKGMTTAEAQLKMADAKVDEMSECGKSLVLGFGASPMHNLTMEFSVADNKAQLTKTSLQYTLDDAKLFPDANKTMGSEKVASKQMTVALSGTNTYFQCSKLDFTLMVANDSMDMVMVALTDVKIQVMGLNNGTYTGSGEVCASDLTTTPKPAPTTAPKTTMAPPTTNKWDVKTPNGSYCLVLQAMMFNVSVKCDNKEHMFSLEMAETQATGMCEDKVDIIKIMSKEENKYSVELTFGMDRSYYMLQNATIMVGTSETGCSSLFMAEADLGTAELRAPTGKVYRCNAEQEIKVGDNATMIMSEVKVQAFREDKSNNFSGSEFICVADSTVSNVVPIAVGCALAGLIIIVLVAYIIGRLRRRPYEPV